MLEELYIKNLAIIEKISLNFTEKFNIITGETGSGKSIIVESINLLSGNRFNKDLIGNFSDKTEIRGVFSFQENQYREFEDLGYIEDGMMIVSRVFSKDGKSSIRINSKPVALKELQKIANELMDIHTQHENQSLFKKEKYLEIVDKYNETFIGPLKIELEKLNKELNFYKSELSKINISEENRNRELEILNYQIEEIESANLEGTSEEEIDAEYEKLSAMSDIKSGIDEFLGYFNRGEYNAEEFLLKSLRSIKDVQKYDNEIFEFAKRFEEYLISIQDLSIDISTYRENLFYDEERYMYLEQIKTDISNLSRKYGKTLNDILNTLKEKKERKKLLSDFEINYKDKEEKVRILSEKFMKKCEELSKYRKKNAIIIENAIIKELKELNIKYVEFNIKFEKANPSIHGFDSLDFLISTNVDSEVKSLNSVASGGEVSRVMIGLKSVFAESDDIDILIFDEIDTGISGRIAQVVGQKLFNISKKHQVIVITHLPQIAAMGDNHIKLIKNQEKNKTKVKAENLTEKSRINEIARLTGGLNITEITLKNAEEMLIQAKEYKERDNG